MNLRSIFFPITRNLRNQLFQANDTEPNYFMTLYSPTHLNSGNYFIGMAVGLFYFHLKASKKDLSKLIVNLKTSLVNHVLCN